MAKLTIDDLKKIKEETSKSTSLRDGKANVKITVHMGTCGIAAGARNIMNVLLKKIEENESREVILTTSGCAGFCSREPMITVELMGKPPVKYIDLTEEKTEKIFLKHVQNGEIVTEYALAIGSEREP